jgi:quinol monooxygenase YgiN
MAQEIDTTFHVTINQGKIEEFKGLVEKLTKAVEDNEAGTKRYQFYLNEDETQCILKESYQNLQAALAHLRGFAFLTIFPKIFKICKVDKIEVFVDINDWKLMKVLLTKALSQMGGVNYHLLVGFSR